MTLILVNQNPALGGGQLGWSSCSCACTAMLIALETAGAKHPSTADVRACIRDEDGSPDTEGGTNPSQNVAAAKRCFGVTLDQSVMDFDDVWALGAREDTALSISISYAPVSGTRYDGSPGFTGLHQVVLSAGKVYDPLADGRRAGIPNGPQPWPKALLEDAAQRYAGQKGRACVIVGRAPAVKPKRYSVKFAPGAIFVYPKSGGRVSRTIARSTSAPCTAPFTIPWLSGRKRVVEITAGFLLGLRVEPTATHMTLVTA